MNKMVLQGFVLVQLALMLTYTARAQLPCEWIRIPTSPTPQGRSNAGMAFDELRGVIVMHGGHDGSRWLNDTWEWNGETWTLVSATGPVVGLHTMAYDAHRGVTVLYGGRNSSVGTQNLNQTWEWDGVSWTRIYTTGNHPRTIQTTLVYDAGRQKVIRHGGLSSGDYTHTDPATYEWDGTNWTAFAHGSHVGAKFGCYDSLREKTVTFAGSSVTNYYQPPVNNETWEFDGTVWTLVSSEGPAKCNFTSLAFDSHRGVSVVFGGVELPGSLFVYSDTWEWNGVEWMETDLRSGAPSPRFAHAMAYDSIRRRVVLFGGRLLSGTRFADTYELGLVPLEITNMVVQADGMIEIEWTGEAPPYQVQRNTGFPHGGWQNVGEMTENPSATMPSDGNPECFHVISLYGSSP